MKAVISVDLHLSDNCLEVLRRQLNRKHLGDENCNIKRNGRLVPKYPEKETEEFRNAHYNLSRHYEKEVELEFDDSTGKLINAKFINIKPQKK